MTTDDDIPLSEDIIRHAAPIGKFLGVPARSVYHAVAKNALPHFRIGDVICARKSTLRAWIVAQEQKARAAA